MRGLLILKVRTAMWILIRGRDSLCNFHLRRYYSIIKLKFQKKNSNLSFFYRKRHFFFIENIPITCRRPVSISVYYAFVHAQSTYWQRNFKRLCFNTSTNVLRFRVHLPMILNVWHCDLYLVNHFSHWRILKLPQELNLTQKVSF